MLELKKGMTAGVICDRVKVKTRAEWEKNVDAIWDKAFKILKTVPGFKGEIAFWDNENTGDVIIMGLWENLEARLNYEATAAPSVRALFGPLFAKNPERHRYILTHSNIP